MYPITRAAFAPPQMVGALEATHLNRGNEGDCHRFSPLVLECSRSSTNPGMVAKTDSSVVWRIDSYSVLEDLCQSLF